MTHITAFLLRFWAGSILDSILLLYLGTCTLTQKPC
uniref:Uncharacterized protein n=1 Tax=Arundo donax TaxID=35708 RepID=A0A0A9EAM5_ARUDO